MQSLIIYVLFEQGRGSNNISMDTSMRMFCLRLFAVDRQIVGSFAACQDSRRTSPRVQKGSRQIQQRNMQQSDNNIERSTMQEATNAAQ